MKKTYVVEVTETLQRQVSVKAESYEEAKALVVKAYKEDEIVLDCDDFTDVQFDCIVEPVERIDSNEGTLLLTRNRVLTIAHTEEGYRWKLETPSSILKKGEVTPSPSIEEIEGVLPWLLRHVGVKNSNIIAKYNGDVTYELLPYLEEVDDDDE